MIDFSDPLGRDLRLLIERLKYERHVSSMIDDLVTREFDRIVDLIVSGRYRDLTAAQRQRATELYLELRKRLDEAYRDIAKAHVAEMQKYAAVEAEIARETVRAAYELAGVGVRLGPSLPRAYLSAIARLPIQGLSIGEWFEAQATSMSLAMKQIIQQGLVEGKGPLQIATRIVADQRTAGPVLVRRARNEARIIARTTVNAVQNDAQMAALSSLPDTVSDAYVYESVLDGRTSDICRALSGRVFRYDDPKRKVPPQHMQCRSSARALLKGVDQPLGDQKTPRTLRNYETWLTARPATEQNDILGRGRAELWRAGKMSLADAIDQDGRTLALKELRERVGLATAGV